MIDTDAFEFNIKIKTWYRDSTKEWVGEIDLDIPVEFCGTNRVTGKTRAAARNATFAVVGHQLMDACWDIEERKDQ